MDTPRIQYAKTRDGVRIGYWDIGTGFPLVTQPYGVYGDLMLEWQIPAARQWYERLARSFRVIRYDPRGLGVSQHDLAGLDVWAPLRDLDATVAACGLEQFGLISDAFAGTALAAARRYTGRLTHLVLFSPIADPDATFENPRAWAIR